MKISPIVEIKLTLETIKRLADTLELQIEDYKFNDPENNGEECKGEVDGIFIGLEEIIEILDRDAEIPEINKAIQDGTLMDM